MSHSPHRSGRRISAWCAVSCTWLCALIGLPSPGVAQDSGGAGVLIEYAEAPGGLEGDFVGPRLTLYDDGSMRVVYPPMMRRAGAYTLQLGSEAVDALVSAVRDPDLAGFDAARVRAQLAAEPPRLAKGGVGPGLSARGDETRIALEVRGEAASAGAQKAGAPARVIHWRGVDRDAAAHPENAALQALAHARRLLRAQMQRSDWVRQ